MQTVEIYPVQLDTLKAEYEWQKRECPSCVENITFQQFVRREVNEAAYDGVTSMIEGVGEDRANGMYE
jgi:hypothetical protein